MHRLSALDRASLRVTAFVPPDASCVRLGAPAVLPEQVSRSNAPNPAHENRPAARRSPSARDARTPATSTDNGDGWAAVDI